MRFENWKGVSALAFIVAVYCAVSMTAQAQSDAKATAVMADVRKALGGEQKIAAMKGLSLRADYRRESSVGGSGGGTMMVVMMGPGGSASSSQQASGKIEIDLDLPNNYLRSDIGSAAFAMTRTEGFEASRPFLEVVPNTPGMRIQVENPANDPARAQAALKRSQTDLARLLLGLTGGTQPGFAVTYKYGGQAESPDGKADIIDIDGPDGFRCRLFVDVETRLPLMLTYMEPEARMVMRTMGPGRSGDRNLPPGLTQEQRDELAKQIRDAESAPPKLVEYRLFFSDYRNVDGISFPYRIARGVGGKTTEEWDVTSYKVNPTFKADRFKVGS
jgi:hypothetical protein